MENVAACRPGSPCALHFSAPLPFFEHPVKSADICVLIFWIAPKFLLPALRSRHGAPNAPDAGKAALVKRIDRDFFGFDIVPYIRVRPINNGIAYGFVLSHARFKEPPSVVVVVVENDSFPRVRVSVLENAPVFLSRGAFSPTNTRCYVAALTAALLENGATIADEPRRRHELLRNEAPHSRLNSRRMK